MVIKRVSFIEAGSARLHFFSKFPIPRLGAGLLSTILRERGYEVKAFVENVAEPDWSFVLDFMVFPLSDFGLTAGQFCFEDKGPDQFKTSFRTLDLVLLFHDDFKKNSHVRLCCF